MNKIYHSPAICKHSSYRHNFSLWTIGPPEQTFNSAGYMVTNSELVSGSINWYYFLCFVFCSCFYFYWYCFSSSLILLL